MDRRTAKRLKFFGWQFLDILISTIAHIEINSVQEACGCTNSNQIHRSIQRRKYMPWGCTSKRAEFELTKIIAAIGVARQGRNTLGALYVWSLLGTTLAQGTMPPHHWEARSARVAFDTASCYKVPRATRRRRCCMSSKTRDAIEKSEELDIEEGVMKVEDSLRIPDDFE